jgi:nucleoside-diphosphate-sugar epimerase
MTARLLFLGGAGMIGSAVARAAVARGDEVTIVTRGEPKRSLPEQVRQLRADVRDAEALRAALGGDEFDSVVNWVAFEPRDLAGHRDLFIDTAGQYVLISTCSVYARPVPQLPITESSPRRQNDFGYPRGKIACEDEMEQAYRSGLPVTIARPFHTYDETTLPILTGATAIERMRAGRPVVVHGDGTSLWTLMHSSDFARAFLPLLGNQHAVGESVNVVSGDILTWDQIHLALAAAAGVRRPRLVHRSSETVGRHVPGLSDVLEHDFRHSMLFDTSKLKRLAPGFAPAISFSEGARQILRHYDASGPHSVDPELDAAFEAMIAEA